VYSTADGMLQANPAPRFTGFDTAAPGAVPGRGEHTDDLLRAAGYAPAEIAALRADGVII